MRAFPYGWSREAMVLGDYDCISSWQLKQTMWKNRPCGANFKGLKSCQRVDKVCETEQGEVFGGPLVKVFSQLP